MIPVRNARVWHMPKVLEKWIASCYPCEIVLTVSNDFSQDVAEFVQAVGDVLGLPDERCAERAQLAGADIVVILCSSLKEGRAIGEKLKGWPTMLFSCGKPVN